MGAAQQILVVDADASSRGQLVELVRGLAGDVVAVDDCAAALAALAAARYGLVIVALDRDAAPPGPLVRSLRSLDPLVELVALVARSDHEGLSSALAQGACCALTRPVDAEALRSVAARALEVRRLRGLAALVGGPPLEAAGGGAAAMQAPVVPGSSIAELERYAILKTLAATGGSTSKAARILRISPRKIQYRLHDYRKAGLL